MRDTISQTAQISPGDLLSRALGEISCTPFQRLFSASQSKGNPPSLNPHLLVPIINQGGNTSFFNHSNGRLRGSREFYGHRIRQEPFGTLCSQGIARKDVNR
ncbi:hypothetical protein FKM82_021443 [Ascaphus truei]